MKINARWRFNESFTMSVKLARSFIDKKKISIVLVAHTS